MGRKDVAREAAVAAGVPVLPQFPLDASGFPTSADVAPWDGSVLVKAVAGGGGKGMRIVRGRSDLDAALSSARREALSAFGDDTLLVERYVEHGRHVEVQILADAHGNVVHLFERDCSAQRRHQKVIEEAPAPTISAAMRRLLHESALALAREVGYVNAGTVEFLVSGEPGQEEAYFLEMNTRLQVEHPVTEMVTGLDIVQLQIRVAAGEPLPFAQTDLTCNGHAFEARVYAEDAFNGFLPQAGVAESVRWSTRARIDAALESGQEVTTAYDPMLGKVVVHGATREAARRALVTALDDTAILGLTTNLGFLRGLADSTEFKDFAVDTAWLDSHPDAIQPSGQEEAIVLGAWALAHAQGEEAGPFGTADGWRLTGPSARTPVELVVNAKTVVLAVGFDDVVAGGRTWQVHPIASEAGVLRLEIDTQVHEAAVRIGRHTVDVAHLGHTFTFPRPDAFGPGDASRASDGTVFAPMPGTVLSVGVEVGAEVEEGDLLAVVEAMKMELALKAPVTGTVTDVGALVGERVALGAMLVGV
ncbi:acetyl/propionyl/methylcrotonyl-CoA carboxylase subunit alpha [soil metagenome]